MKSVRSIISNMRIRTAILIPMIVMPVVTATTILIMLVSSFSNTILEDYATQLTSYQQVLHDEINAKKIIANHCTRLISLDPAFVRAVEGGSRPAILASVTEYITAFDVDFCTVTDANGIVMFRYHQQDKYGDSLADQYYYIDAIAGRSFANVDTGEVVKLSIISSMPIYSEDGVIIGCIFTGTRLDDNVFVDEMKATLGTEVTVFLGDERISTTVTGDDGRRATGTRAAENVAEEVLVFGNDYTGVAQVLGRDAFVSYSPIFGPDGSAIGMLFTGIYKDPADKIISDFIYNGATIALVLITISMIIAYLTSRMISEPLLTLSGFMKNAADGDFSLRLSADYGAEIGQLFNAGNALIEYNDLSITNMRGSVEKIRESAQGMLDISTDLSEGSTSLNKQMLLVSSSAEEFSAAMTQSSHSLTTASNYLSTVASSIEEMNASIASVAVAAGLTNKRTQQASKLVGDIQGSIAKASDTVSYVSDAFSRVAAGVQETNVELMAVSEHCTTAMDKMSVVDEKAKNTKAVIMQLEAASKEIGKIIGMISAIAKQTNILSLNAAIEAAGAGEAGKGFMVVANEVKDLAKQTSAAADEIADHIDSAQKSLPKAVSVVAEIADIINDMTEFMLSFSNEVAKQGIKSGRITSETVAAAQRMSEISSEIGSISENAVAVTEAAEASSKEVEEIAKSAAELVAAAREVAMNTERVSGNISEIDRATKEMTSGITEISKNIQYINKESAAVQLSAHSSEKSSEALLATANEMDGFISKFKTSGA